MFKLSTYVLIILSISSGLLSLLGSVGIFVSLIIQRRVERLQEILEELVEQSYHEERNLTGKIYRLIESYQMYYIMPSGPTKIILRYLDLTMLIVVAIWLGMLMAAFEPPWQDKSFIYLVPIIGGIAILIFFRRLLQNAINPLENTMLNVIIPPPRQLRSVAFLSRYVNVSVLSLLKQARISFVLRCQVQGDDGQVVVNAQAVLKEELSLDDFFYYFYLQSFEQIHLIAFGHLIINFPPDPLTRKPVPVQRNINVPLGWCQWNSLPRRGLKAHFLLFPLGEKHPIYYLYNLWGNSAYFTPDKQPEININRDITFKVKDNRIIIINGKEKIPGLNNYQDWFKIDGKRRYVFQKSSNTDPDKKVKLCENEISID